MEYIKLLMRKNESFDDSARRKLREACASSLALRLLLDEYSSRQRNRRVTKTEWVQNRFKGKITRSDVIGGLRILEDLGYGKYIEGRRGQPSRFEWSKSSLAVAQLATELDSAQPAAMDVVGEDEDPDMDMIVRAFDLRDELRIEFELPKDLTPREAERIGLFIASCAS